MRSVWFAGRNLFSLRSPEPCLDARLQGLYEIIPTLESADTPAKRLWNSEWKRQASRAG